MKLYKGKYRIKSSRLASWDYTNNGYYFVTICTKNKKPFFGSIRDEKMELTQIGKIVADEWMRTEIVREYVIMDEWIIMPNHLHGILIIDRNDITTSFSCTLKPDSLGSIIGQFKSKATKKIKEEGFDYFG